jgi:hypothetical protein
VEVGEAGGGRLALAEPAAVGLEEREVFEALVCGTPVGAATRK